VKSSAALRAAIPAVMLLAAACTDRAAEDAPPAEPAAPAATSGTTPGSTASPSAPATPTTIDGVTITPNPESEIRTFSTRQWRTDFTRHTIPFDEIGSGGPGKDGIPAIDEPRFVTPAEAASFLGDAEPVVAVQFGGEARAYPLQILIWHEIVNDTVGGRPVAVTYCPLCNTAIVFSRVFEGEQLDFGTTGNLRFSDLVMYDRQTESWWQQASGEAIVGTHAGRRLDFLPGSIISFADFVSAYPDGTVLSRETGFNRDYGRNPYTGYDTSGDPFLFSGPLDGRLGAMERIVSLVLNGEAVAYPFSVLERELVVNDEVGGRPVVVFFRPGVTSALDASAFANSRDVGAGVAYRREIDGRVLTFEVDGEVFADRETGSRWNVAGQAIGGPLAGRQLEPVVHGNHFWFVWAVFEPETRLYGG
jgi:hypothetical protein